MTVDSSHWHRVASKQIADCRVFRVREDFCRRDDDAAEGSFFVLENSDWVNIIARTKNGEIVVIEQFRHGLGTTIVEIPGGMVDKNERPLDAAMRELSEETGYTSTNWKLLGRSHPNPAIQNNSLYHFLALDCEKTRDVAFDEHENIQTRLVAENVIEDLIKDGTISHSLVVSAFCYYSVVGKSTVSDES